LNGRKILLYPPEAVKKLRPWEIGGISPWTMGEAFPPPLNFFTVSIFQRGIKSNLLPNCEKALLPLEKGGREGFLGRSFQKAKGLPKKKKHRV
jgi:hypothetical protein